MPPLRYPRMPVVRGRLRGPFLAAADELEEEVGGFGFEGDVADFVDGQQGVELALAS
jgi:hypothetical protein